MEERPAKALDRLIVELRRLPGVGARSAQRLAQHVMRAPREEGLRLARAIEEALAQVRPCSLCHDLGESDPCTICSDPGRVDGTLCVVEDPWALRRIEKAAAFRGRYHVLHGALNPLKGIGPDELRVPELVARVREGTVREVILATSPTSEGEATASLVARALGALPVRVTRLAYGIPVGSPALRVPASSVPGTCVALCFVPLSAKHRTPRGRHHVTGKAPDPGE
jgi:recombination protein RecR